MKNAGREGDARRMRRDQNFLYSHLILFLPNLKSKTFCSKSGYSILLHSSHLLMMDYCYINYPAPLITFVDDGLLLYKLSCSG